MWSGLCFAESLESKADHSKGININVLIDLLNAIVHVLEIENIGKSNFSYSSEHWILLKFPMCFLFMQVWVILYSLTVKPSSSVRSRGRHPMPTVPPSINTFFHSLSVLILTHRSSFSSGFGKGRSVLICSPVALLMWTISCKDSKRVKNMYYPYSFHCCNKIHMAGNLTKKSGLFSSQVERLRMQDWALWAHPLTGAYGNLDHIRRDCEEGSTRGGSQGPVHSKADSFEPTCPYGY